MYQNEYSTVKDLMEWVVMQSRSGNALFGEDSETLSSYKL